MLLKIKNVTFLFCLLAVIILQSCYTEVVLPKHTIKQNKVDSNRIADFTHTVIDTFYNEWLPDEGYYYQFRFDLKVIKEEKIDAFLNMLYAKGYDVLGAWYLPAREDCHQQEWMLSGREETGVLRAMFYVLLSDFDDSIMQYNLYALAEKPNYFPCPYNVWEFLIE